MDYSNKYNEIIFYVKVKAKKTDGSGNKTINFPGTRHIEDQGQKYTGFWII